MTDGVLDPASMRGVIVTVTDVAMHAGTEESSLLSPLPSLMPTGPDD